MRSLSIVIPAYNEELRLPATLRGLQLFLATQKICERICEVIVVNDGSTDQTAGVVEDFQREWHSLFCISFEGNQGKGAAIHSGMKWATGEWILIADADMSTPWEELLILAQVREPNYLVMGSRGLPTSNVEVKQHWIRQNMGKTFNRILQALVGLPFQDTQCGFKLIRNNEFFRRCILPQLKVQRFAWDVELILFLLAYRKGVIEVPVRWRHQEQSRVRIVSDSAEMLLSVLKLKIRIRKIQKICSATE